MQTDPNRYLKPTVMLDYHHERIQLLIKEKGWHKRTQKDAIAEIYAYVRDDIVFGYNWDDTVSASTVLKNGYGQCNTKGTLLMALLRAVGIETRFHGFTIYNALQRGAIPDYLFFFAPKKIIHSWVEVYHEGQWLELEGYIIDQRYLSKVQEKFSSQCESFSGYGIATACLNKPENVWEGGNTYIQRDGIADDFGVFEQPDEFYQQKGSNLKGARKWLYRLVLRHLINFNVNKIRLYGVS